MHGDFTQLNIISVCMAFRRKKLERLLKEIIEICDEIMANSEIEPKDKDSYRKLLQ